MIAPTNTDNYTHEPKYALIASIFAVGTVTALIVLKIIAYWLSGSTAVLSTLADSIVDIAVSIMMLLAVRYSLKPADEQHRHGHGKIEGIAALFQGAFMAAAGLFILFEALHKFMNPEEVQSHALAIIVAVTAIGMTLVLVSVQKYCLQKAPSLAIEADYAHYKSDIFLNLAVIIVLFADYKGAPIWFDPLIAIGIAIYFFIIAGRISLQSLDMLMDKEVSFEHRRRIEAIVNAHEEALGIHDLRTRRSGMTLHISFDVEMNPDMTLCQSHGVVRELEQEIVTLFPNAEVLIHVDPHGDTADTRHKVAGVHH
ncbi:MAG: hypothetical protein CMH31_02210 [Micavibrio sp.]|nr:hypothetical protein [Micavibrio sp.]